MKLDADLLAKVREAGDVIPGNVYPARGGSKLPGTEFWLVIAVSANGAHVVGFDAQGQPVSATNYTKAAMRERPLLGRVDMSALVLKAVPV